MAQKTMGALIIGYDFSAKPNGKDASVLIVGEQDKDGVTKIINAFDGREAEELYKKLITKRNKKEGTDNAQN